jgi:hypothetical protein
VDSTSAVNDYYELLGVPRSASDLDIKRAWRKKAQRAHPDRGGSEAAFNQLRLAYETLSTPTEKARYDAELDRDQEAAAQDKLRRDAAYRASQQRRANVERPYPRTPQRRESTLSSSWRRAPHFVRDNAKGAVIILVVAWAGWLFSRAGVLHAKNLAQIMGQHVAPSLSGGALVVTFGLAFVLASVVSAVVRKLRVGMDFAGWLGAGLAGLYVEPVAWIPLVQQIAVGVAVVTVAWVVFAKAAPSKATALTAWRPGRKRS